jgi:PAS domain S-box-containing protein
VSETLRKTGIHVIGVAPWSTHFCQLYQTKEDLLEILVPYFKAGLVNNEFCMWVTSEPLTAEEASKAMSKAMRGFSKYVKKGQIEIIPYWEWYLKGGFFNSQRVLNGWVDKLNSALDRGFDGLRLTSNTFWLEKKDWKSFADYEAKVTSVIGNYKILALCTYCLDRCNAVEVMDVIRNHEFALIKQAAKWDMIENSAYKIAKEALIESQEKFERLYSSMTEGVAVHDIVYDDGGKAVDYIITNVNPAFEAITGLKKEAATGRKATVLYQTGEPPYLDIYARVAETGQSTAFETYFLPMEKHFSISVFSPEKGKFATVFSDITERKREEAHQKQVLEESREHVAKLEEQRIELELMNEELHAAQETLQESRDRYLELYNSAPVGYLVLEQHAIIREANQTLVNMLGVSKNELEGASFLRFVAPESGTGLKRYLNRVFETGTPQKCEIRIRRGDGSYFYAMLGSISTRNPQTKNPQCRTTVSDITEQKQAEERMESIAKEWQMTFDSIQDMVSIQDKDFKLVRVNKAYEDAIGMKEEELIGQKCYEIVHGSPCPPSVCPHRQTVKTRQSITEEIFEPRLEIYLEATTSPILDENGSVVGTVHIAKDITERKQMEDVLQHEKDKLKNILDSMEDGVYIANKDYTIEYVNPAMVARFGRSTGQKCYQYLHGLQEICPWCQNDRVFKGERVHRELHFPKVSAVFDLTDTPLVNPDGSISKLEILHDVTERKRTEDRINALNVALLRRTAELEAANKELEAFGYSVSHDLRAPLRSINGFSQAISQDYADKLDGQGKDYLRRICNASQLMAQLIDDMLRLSKATMTELHYEKVNLSEMVEQIGASLHNLQPERQVELVVGPRIEASGDPALLRQVMENLLGNAFKFTGKNKQARIEFGVKKTADAEVYYLRDNGAGFDLTYADKLFKPFQRLHSQADYPGTGIGLALIQRIIKRHGGRIWAEAQPGKGATFLFTLSQP